MAMLYPWGIRGQLAGGAGAAIGYVLALQLGASPKLPVAYGILVVAGAEALALAGAYLLDNQRLKHFNQAAALRGENSALDGLLKVLRELDPRVAQPDLLRDLCQNVVESLGVAWASILFFKKGRETAVPVASYGVPPPTLERFTGYEFTRANTPRFDEIQAAQPVVLHLSASCSVEERTLLERLGVDSIAVVPFERGNTARGVLATALQPPQRFARKQVRALEAIAWHVASALALAELLRKSDQAARFQAGLIALAIELSVQEDPEAALEITCRHGQGLFGASCGAVLIPHEDRLVGTLAESEDPNAKQSLSIPLHDETLPAARALATGNVIVGAGIGTNEGPDAAPPLRGVLAVPFYDGHEGKGVFLFGHSKGPQSFDEDTVEKAKMLGLLTGGIMRRFRLVGQIQETNKALQRANLEKDRVLASASHDLRSPLNVIIGYSQLALEGTFGELSSELHDVLRRIVASGSEQLLLVEDLLTVSLLALERVELELRPFPLAPILDDTAAIATGLLGKRPVQVKLHPIDSTLCVYADPARLKQVLTNLVSNAVKFTTEGSIELHVVGENGRIRVGVTDTGPGIPPNDRERIFEPFFQSACGKSTAGAGLGLAIAQRLVRLMGGSLTVESEMGGGSTFWLTLATEPPDDQRLCSD